MRVFYRVLPRQVKTTDRERLKVAKELQDEKKITEVCDSWRESLRPRDVRVRRINPE